MLLEFLLDAVKTIIRLFIWWVIVMVVGAGVFGTIGALLGIWLGCPTTLLFVGIFGGAFLGSYTYERIFRSRQV